MPKFKVVGKGRDTGRTRRKHYRARDEQSARAMAEADGMEVTEVVLLPPEPPTEAQIECARELAISIPDNITGEELSDLISITTWKDKRATPELVALAVEYGAVANRFTGKKLLFGRILAELVMPGREEELAAWFVYRVYREMVRGMAGAPIASPKDERIRKIAVQLASDASVMKSIRKYQGQDLIWFGQWTSPQGYVMEGGSNRTIAYKKAMELLKAAATDADVRSHEPLPERHYERRTPSADFMPASARPAVKPSGCLGVLVAATTVLVAAASAATWIVKISI